MIKGDLYDHSNMLFQTIHTVGEWYPSQFSWMKNVKTHCKLLFACFIFCFVESYTFIVCDDNLTQTHTYLFRIFHLHKQEKNYFIMLFEHIF